MAMLAVGFGSLFSGSTLLRIGIFGASLAGSFLSNKDSSKSERLEDLKVSSSAYGKGLGIVYGTNRVTGNMFWSTDFEEEKKLYKKGGKKQMSSKKAKKKGDKKGQEVYEYYANFAMGLCEGPVKEVLRVWADSNLIYDKYGVDDEEVVGPGFSEEQNGGTSKKGGKSSKGKGGSGGDSGRFGFRFYNGSEEQEADPFMVSVQGASNVPAYRGLAYLFFEHFSLSDFGNRTPTITAEVSVESNKKLYGRQFDPLEHKLNDTAANLGIEDLSYPTLDYGTKTYIDPIYKRLYITDQSAWCRVYDLSTFEELKRVNLITDIPEVTVGYMPKTYLSFDTTVDSTYPGSGLTVSGTNLNELVGVAATGDLVFRGPGGNNVYPFVLVDPISFVPKMFFGGKSGNFWGGEDLFSVSDVTYFTFTNVVTEKVDYITVVYNTAGQYVMFNQQYQVIGIMENSFSAIPTYRFTEPLFMPGDATTSDLHYMLHGDFYTGYTLYQYVGIPDVGPYSYYGSSAGATNDTINDATSRYNSLYSRLLNEVYGESAIVGASACYVVGVDAIGIIERVQGTSGSGGVYIVKIDPSTGELLWRAKMADNFSAASEVELQPLQTGNKISFYYDNYMYEADLFNEEVSSYRIPADNASLGDPRQTYLASVGGIIGYLQGSIYSDVGVLYIDKKVKAPATMKTIVADQCQRVGLDIGTQIDMSGLTDSSITGVLLDTPRSARDTIDMFAKLFQFEVVESDYILKFVDKAKPGAYDEAIVQSKLGIVETVGEGFEALKETHEQEIDLPQTVNVSFIDPSNKYNTNNQHVRRPNSPLSTLHTREKLDISLPIAMTADTAKTMAHRILYGMWSERKSVEFRLSWEYIGLDPTDVVQITMDNGYQFTSRLIQADIGANYEMDCVAIAHNNGSYSATVTGSSTGGVINRPKSYPSSARVLAFDVPYAFEADVDNSVRAELYLAIGALGDNYSYASIVSDSDSGPQEAEGIFNLDVPWGTLSGELGAPDDFHLTDTVTQLRITPSYDYEAAGIYEWVSIADASWPSESNTIIVGDEIIRFKDVTDNGDGTYTLTTLIRGDRGTETACDKHTGADIWVIPNTDGMKDDVRPVSDIGSYVTYEASMPSFTSIAFPASFLLEGKSMWTWGPSNIQRSDSGGDSIVTWERRARIGGQWKDGTGSIPLNEELERYEAYILSAPYDEYTFDPGDASTYIRKFADLSSATFTYASADKTTDGFASDDDFHVVIFQLGTYITRGFPGYALTSIYAK